jgi:predicted ATP-grasp superfamily ATP-dependent carboligase
LKILLLGSQSYKSVVLARFLKKNLLDCTILGFTNSNLGKFLHSKYIDEVFVNKTLTSDLLKDFDYIIPVTSSWARFVALNRALFDDNSLLQGDSDTFGILDDKMKFKELCGSLHIPTPRLLELSKLQDFPVMIKKVIGEGSKEVYRINSHKELKQLTSQGDFNSNQHLIEEFINGVGVGITAFCRKGEVICSNTHLRLLEWPSRGGSSTFRSNFYNDEIGNILNRIVEHTKWTGFLMIECKLENDFKLKVIEANPRIWGSISQSLVHDSFSRPLLLHLFGAPTIKNLPKENSEQFTYQSPLVYLSIIFSMFSRIKNVTFFFKTKQKLPDIKIFSDPKGWLGQFLR